MSEPGPDPRQDPRAEQFRAEYALREKRQHKATMVLGGWTVFCLLAMGILLRYETPLALAPVSGMFLGIFVAAAFQFLNNRCPCCNRGQARQRKPRFCYNCGTRFRD